jgi:hypothetical protein
MERFYTCACMDLNWTALGKEARASVDDADLRLTDDPNDTRPICVREAYSFLLNNPECFGREDWPAEMPQEPNIEFIAAYYRVGEGAAQ